MDADAQLVEDTAKRLGESWDAVVIMCSRHEMERTRTTFKGSGNWHTQYGMVREWLVTNDERTREATREGE